jgi:hypothetical protein
MILCAYVCAYVCMFNRKYCKFYNVSDDSMSICMQLFSNCRLFCTTYLKRNGEKKLFEMNSWIVWKLPTVKSMNGVPASTFKIWSHWKKSENRVFTVSRIFPPPKKTQTRGSNLIAEKTVKINGKMSEIYFTTEEKKSSILTFLHL